MAAVAAEVVVTAAAAESDGRKEEGTDPDHLCVRERERERDRAAGSTPASVKSNDRQKIAYDRGGVKQAHLAVKKKISAPLAP